MRFLQLTPCTTMPWLMVSGKSTACTTSQGTPEASSCETQKAGDEGEPQEPTDRVFEKMGDAWICAARVGRRRAQPRDNTPWQQRVCMLCWAVAGLLSVHRGKQATLGPRLAVGKVALKAYSSGRRRLNSDGDVTASSQTSSCCAMVVEAAKACAAGRSARCVDHATGQLAAHTSEEQARGGPLHVIPAPH